MTALFEAPQFGGTEPFFRKVVSDILKDRQKEKGVSIGPSVRCNRNLDKSN